MAEFEAPVEARNYFYLWDILEKCSRLLLGLWLVLAQVSRRFLLY